MQPALIRPSADAIDVDAQAAADIRRWREHPPQMVADLWPGCQGDGWQVDVLEEFPHRERIALKACVGPGKTWLLAMMVINFLVTRPKPRIYCTSITWPNLRDNLWAELGLWISKSPTLRSVFEWTQHRIKAREDPESWWCSARNWSHTADREALGQTLAGLHSDYCMAVADESGGMPLEVVASGEGVLSSAVEGKIVQAGNPTHLSGPLHQACTVDRERWLVVEISGDPDRADRAPRVKKSWARENIKSWGRDSAWCRARVLGLFPNQATDRLIPLSNFEDAYGRTHDNAGNELQRGLKILACDVARLGDDRTTVYERDGDFIDSVDEWIGVRTNVTADRLHTKALEQGSDEIRIDDIGVGGGVTDNLMARRGTPYTVVPINVSEKATKLGKPHPRTGKLELLYENMRAQIGFEVRDKMAAGRVSLPVSARESTLSREGTDLVYGTGRGGKVLKLESKDDYRKRHQGQSPDHWDGFAMAVVDGTGGSHQGLRTWMRQQAAKREAEASGPRVPGGVH